MNLYNGVRAYGSHCTCETHCKHNIDEHAISIVEQKYICIHVFKWMRLRLKVLSTLPGMNLYNVLLALAIPEQAHRLWNLAIEWSWPDSIKLPSQYC